MVWATLKEDRAIAQAVSCRLPTAAVRVPSQVMRDLWWTKGHWGWFFSEYFGFPCKFLFHQMFHTRHLSSGAGTIGQLVADVQNGPSHPTPPHEIKKNTSEMLRDV
jgi:hypothetical protein